MRRITFDDIVRFKKYNDMYGTWGSLHIVLDDDNTEDNSVEFCIKYAEENGDTEGKELAEILLQMSEKQRIRLGKIMLGITSPWLTNANLR